jgi:processing peptidase subunit beta
LAAAAARRLAAADGAGRARSPALPLPRPRRARLAQARHGARAFSTLGLQTPTCVTTLPNGLRVATESMPGQTATVGVWVDTGSRFESEHNNGAAHVLEHLIFKGTAKRSQYELEIEVENMGAHLNAYTSREQTVYYAKALASDVGKSTELLADLLSGSKLSADAVERERDVILREMEEVEGQLEEVVFDRLHEVAFRGTPLSRTILGPKANIASMTAETIREYVKTHYTADRMVVVAAGGVTHDQVVKLAEANFGAFAPRPAVAPFAWEPSLFTGAEVRVHDDGMAGGAHLAIAFEGLSWNDPDVYALQMLGALLGSFDAKAARGAGLHSSSKLVHDLARDDLASSMVPFCTCYTDTGLFGVYAVASDKNELDDLSLVILDEMVRLCFTVSDADTMRAAQALKANLAMSLDGTSHVAEDIGRQLITYGRRIPLAEAYQRIDDVTPDDLMRVANRVIWDQEIAVAGRGGRRAATRGACCSGRALADALRTRLAPNLRCGRVCAAAAAAPQPWLTKLRLAVCPSPAQRSARSSTCRTITSCAAAPGGTSCRQPAVRHGEREATRPEREASGDVLCARSRRSRQALRLRTHWTCGTF